MNFLDRRANPDDAKLATQRFVTYVILLIFSAVTAGVFNGNDQAERSTIIQTVINVLMLAVGYWLGSSKGATDKDASISRIAEGSAPAAAAAVAAAAAAPATAIKTEEVKIEAETATVSAPAASTTSTTLPLQPIERG